ncbi:hypothetical protein DFH28DRAFT_922898 [Melampsora americana]|nr:hypothetical protein DFH28DRAFT_922898 [Melampsora americana]
MNVAGWRHWKQDIDANLFKFELIYNDASMGNAGGGKAMEAMLKVKAKVMEAIPKVEVKMLEISSAQRVLGCPSPFSYPQVCDIASYTHGEESPFDQLMSLVIDQNHCIVSLM